MSAFTYKRITVALTKRVREETPNAVSFKSVPDGSLTGDVDVVIDERLLHALAIIALRNKSRRAVVGKGLVICKAKNVTHTPQQ